MTSKAISDLAFLHKVEKGKGNRASQLRYYDPGDTKEDSFLEIHDIECHGDYLLSYVDNFFGISSVSHNSKNAL